MGDRTGFCLRPECEFLARGAEGMAAAAWGVEDAGRHVCDLGSVERVLRALAGLDISPPWAGALRAGM